MNWHNLLTREDHREARDWKRPWRDAPGAFWCCCPGAGGAQQYYCMGGAQLGGSRLTQNYQWASAWTTKAVLSSARDSMAASTPTTTSSLYTYGGVSNVAFLTQSDSYASSDTWSTNTAMSSPQRYRAQGVAISSQSYSWGGWNSSNVTQTRNEQMTPGSPSSWTTKSVLTVAKANGAAANIGAKGYHTCGVDGTNANVATTYEYDPSGDSWATKASCPAPAKSGLAGFSIASIFYVMYGSPDTTRRTDGYIVNSWSSYATAVGALDQYPSSAAVEATGVGWSTGGTTSGAVSIGNHSEYTSNAWSTRTVIPNVTTNPSSAIT